MCFSSPTGKILLQFHQLVTISRLWRQATFHCLNRYWRQQWKKYMTYDITLKYMTVLKILWQFNNSSRILQELLKSQTITKRTPKTLTQKRVMLKLSNKYLIRQKWKIFLIFHHFFPHDVSEVVFPKFYRTSKLEFYCVFALFEEDNWNIDVLIFSIFK